MTMKPYSMAPFLLFALAFSACGSEASLTNALAAVKIPAADFRQEYFTNVVSQLNGYLEENHLAKLTVNLSLPEVSVSTNAAAFPQQAKAHIAHFLTEYAPRTNMPPQVTFSARWISLLEALKIVAAISGLDLIISDQSIVMRAGPPQLTCDAFHVWPVSHDLPLWIETSVFQPWAQAIVPNTNVVLLIDSPERLKQFRQSQTLKLFTEKDGHNKEPKSTGESAP